jgi:hypothetical protein
MKSADQVLTEFHGKSRRDMAERIAQLEHLVALLKEVDRMTTDLRRAGLTEAQLSDMVDIARK